MSLLEKQPGAPAMVQSHWGDVVELLAQMLREHAAQVEEASADIATIHTETNDE
jgi:hypothetical protein